MIEYAFNAAENIEIGLLRAAFIGIFDSADNDGAF